MVAEAERYAADRDRLIVSDTRIFGGQPVIAGTRIPVHTVAERLVAGDTIAVFAEDYPHVDPRAFEVAARYSRTHPRRGRPVKPWRGTASPAGEPEVRLFVDENLSPRLVSVGQTATTTPLAPAIGIYSGRPIRRFSIGPAPGELRWGGHRSIDGALIPSGP